MANVPLGSPTTGASVAAQIDPAKLWQATIDRHEENNDFYQPLEGGQGAYIMEKTDTSKGKGQELVIRVESGLYDEPHYGDDLFDSEDDFEENLFEEYKLNIDVIRHGTSATERSEELSGLRGEIISKLPAKLGRWAGRVKTENLDMMFLNRINSENIILPNGKTASTLVAADGLSYNYVSTASSALARLGGQKGEAGTYADGRSKGKKAYRHLLVCSKDAMTVLKQDSAYQTVLANAAQRGRMNPYFSGEIHDLDGVTILERDVIDHDGEGAIGSPLNPRAKLGAAVTAGTAAFDILGGGNPTSGAKAKKLYYKYFPGHAYKFSDGTSLSQGADTRYVLIINPPNAPTDPNKIGMYSYTTGNNGNKITVVQRLGSAASGQRVTTLGDVQWNTGAWANMHTDVHPAGALVIPCNRKGEPIGYSLLLARGAALRGYGKHRNKRGQETEEDGYVTKVFFRTYFGQVIRQDRLGRHTGVMLMQHALHYKDLPLPAVV